MSFFNQFAKIVSNSFDPIGLFGNKGNAPYGSSSILGDTWDKFKNGNTNEVNWNISKENLGFQRENLDYQKALQREIFDREDTAYQRTVNDMRKAGLNPLSMSGTNGAGEVINTEAMHNDYQHTDTSSLMALNQIFNTMNQLSTMRNNSTITNAQANLINAQAENQKIKNVYENDLLSNQLESLNLGNIGKQFSNERDSISWLQEQRNYMFNKQFGLSNNMPDFAKILNYATHQGKLNENDYKEYKPDWENFGKRFLFENENPNFNNLQSVLENSNLKGAISESKIGEIFLRLLGIGI